MLTEQKQITLCSQSSNQSICSLVRALAYGVTIGRVFKNATLRTHQPELDVARATCVDVYAPNHVQAKFTGYDIVKNRVDRTTK